eukprot:g3898.t1
MNCHEESIKDLLTEMKLTIQEFQKIAQTLAQICPKLAHISAQQLPMCPPFAQGLPKIAHSCPNTCPTVAHLPPMCPALAQNCPALAQNCPNTCPKVAHVPPICPAQ